MPSGEGIDYCAVREHDPEVAPGPGERDTRDAATRYPDAYTARSARADPGRPVALPSVRRPQPSGQGVAAPAGAATEESAQLPDVRSGTRTYPCAASCIVACPHETTLVVPGGSGSVGETSVAG
jgi:hypothetical protein